MCTRLFLCLVILFGASFGTLAQDFKHTLELAAGESGGTSGAEIMAWLAGKWQGDALGGQVEEMWGDMAGGQMVGSFQFVKGGKVGFYEIQTLAKNEDGVLELRVKHFNGDMTGWEEAEEMERFTFIKFDGNSFYFDGLTFVRESRKRLVIWVRIDQDGKVSEEAFRYRRSRG